METLGYSKKAIAYYVNNVNVESIDKTSASAPYTSPFGDTLEVNLNITYGIITDAKFQAIGCAGARSNGGTLTENLCIRSV